MVTPTQRSLRLMRGDGYYCEITEHYNSFTRRRNDLLGFCDILCLKKDHSPILLQTTAAGISSRIKKILEEDKAKLALQCGFKILVHGWRPLAAYKKDGSRAKKDRWEPKIRVVNLDDF